MSQLLCLWLCPFSETPRATCSWARRLLRGQPEDASCVGEAWSAQQGGQTAGPSASPNESIQPANVGTLLPLARGTAQGQGQ